MGPKEKARRAAEQDRADVAEGRAAWRAGLAKVAPERPIFVDETGTEPGWRAYVRAPRGQRAPGKVPWGRWERLTVVGALALGGVIAAVSVPAATGTAVFLAFTEQRGAGLRGCRRCAIGPAPPS